MADKPNPAAPQNATDQRPGSSSSSQPTTSEGAQAQGNSPNGSSSNGAIPCQWSGCGEYHPNPEALYDHVCEKHVGRKSTNNLNLTCAWGNCHTTTVKRDHITSHIRVHVPLKPHKCDLCGKSFKRPQDLKKHVKTHAEDPNQGMRGHDGPSSRPHQNGYHHLPGPPRMDGYGYGGGMQGHHGVNYPYPTHGGGMHYVPTSHGGGAPAGHYGQVYYPAAAPIGQHNFADGRDGGFAATQRLFDDMRRESFNPKDYGAVSNLLMGMQQYQLPMPMMTGAGGGGDYGVATATAPGGGFGGFGNMHAQAAPSFPNIRTKKDLLEINQILQEMTATAYENPSHLSTQPIVPPGSMNINVGRSSHSPPSMALHHAHASDATSEHLSTPALTPGSTTMSYSAGHSPPAMHSNTVSPTAATYPSLPTLPDGSQAGNMGPVDTLGTQYDRDVRRRYSGGNLQQRAPAARRGSGDMDIDTPTTDRKGKSKRDPTIDPALGGSTGSSGSSGSSSAASVASDDTATPGREEEAAHGFNLRLLENLKNFISGKLERGEYDGEKADDDDVNDVDDDDERVRRALTQDEDMEDAEDKAVPKPDVAYPELKM